MVHLETEREQILRNFQTASQVINAAVDTVIEDIQQAQVECGGRFFRREEVENMTVIALLRLLIPNKVEFNVKYKGE